MTAWQTAELPTKRAPAWFGQNAQKLALVVDALIQVISDGSAGCLGEGSLQPQPPSRPTQPRVLQAGLEQLCFHEKGNSIKLTAANGARIYCDFIFCDFIYLSLLNKAIWVWFYCLIGQTNRCPSCKSHQQMHISSETEGTASDLWFYIKQRNSLEKKNQQMNVCLLQY